LEVIQLKQQDLRALESGIKLQMYHIHQSFTGARSRVQANPVDEWFQTATQSRVYQRQQLNEREQKALAPFEALVREIDATIHALNHTKLDIDRWISENRAQRR
jgi:hypothetical protein